MQGLKGWFANTTISGKAYFNVSNIHQTSTDLAGETDRQCSERHADRTQALLPRHRSQVQRHLLGQPDDRFPLQRERHQQGRAHLCQEGLSAGEAVDRRSRSCRLRRPAVGTVRRGRLRLSLRREHADRPHQVRDVGRLGRPRRSARSATGWSVMPSRRSTARATRLCREAPNTIDLEGRVSVNPIKISHARRRRLHRQARQERRHGQRRTHRGTRFNALAAYTDKRIRAGVEYFSGQELEQRHHGSAAVPTSEHT